MKLRVMVVEDEKGELEAIKSLLQKRDKTQVIANNIEDVDVTLADCASVARKLLEEAAQHSKPYDILLLDLGLPENPGEREVPELGLQLLELARKQQVAEIIIVLSVFTQIEGHVAPAFRRGATDILGKPYRDEQLLDTISRNWLNTQAESQSGLQGISQSKGPLNGPDTSDRQVRVFLNYALEDQTEVLSLYHKLTDEGFIPWMDIQDLLPGEVWKFAILKAIRDTDFVLVCLSSKSVLKRSFLQREIKEALEIWKEKLIEDIYLIPVRLEDCVIPTPLQDFQWVDIFEANGWDKLVKAIRAGALRRLPKAV